MTAHDDGTSTVEGATGDDTGDTWSLGGAITGFSADQPATTTLSGLSVDPDSLGSG